MLICGDDVQKVAIVFLLQATTPIPGTLDNFHNLDQNHLKQGHISNFLNLGHYIIGERNQPKYFPAISSFINYAMQMYHDLIIYIYHKLVGKEVLVLHQNHATSWPKWYEAKPRVRPGQMLKFFPNCQVRVSTEFNNTFRPNGRMETHVHTSFLVSTSSPAYTQPV